MNFVEITFGAAINAEQIMDNLFIDFDLLISLDSIYFHNFNFSLAGSPSNHNLKIEFV